VDIDFDALLGFSSSNIEFAFQILANGTSVLAQSVGIPTPTITHSATYTFTASGGTDTVSIGAYWNGDTAGSGGALVLGTRTLKATVVKR
jgi:hypothetical protein